MCYKGPGWRSDPSPWRSPEDRELDPMQMADAPQDMEARVALWLEQHQDMADRWRAMMVEIRAAVGTDYAMYAVANRELLDLALSGQSVLQPA